LQVDPRFILFVADRIEADIDTQVRSLEKQFLHDISGILIGTFEKNTQ
jgi:hypothetical protein